MVLDLQLAPYLVLLVIRMNTHLLALLLAQLLLVARSLLLTNVEQLIVLVELMEMMVCVVLVPRMNIPLPALHLVQLLVMDTNLLQINALKSNVVLELLELVELVHLAQ